MCSSNCTNACERVAVNITSLLVVSELIARVVSLQVRLQGDAPQLHLLFGAPRQATGLLSLPRGAAGKKSVYSEKALLTL